MNRGVFLFGCGTVVFVAGQLQEVHNRGLALYLVGEISNRRVFGFVNPLTSFCVIVCCAPAKSVYHETGDRRMP
jgi:hypothetical protein